MSEGDARTLGAAMGAAIAAVWSAAWRGLTARPHPCRTRPTKARPSHPAQHDACITIRLPADLKRRLAHIANTTELSRRRGAVLSRLERPYTLSTLCRDLLAVACEELERTPPAERPKNEPLQ